MSIFRKDVEHIAHLARIELDEEEKIKFEKELSAILQFVEKLNEVDTAGVEPMTGGTNLENIMRADEQTEKNLERKTMELIEAAPNKKDRWVKVKAVFW
mgnify:CR=1 FL=1